MIAYLIVIGRSLSSVASAFEYRICYDIQKINSSKHHKIGMPFFDPAPIVLLSNILICLEMLSVTNLNIKRIPTNLLPVM